MNAKYEKIYSEQRHVLGVPNRQLVKFVESNLSLPSSVLDLGCGQGRDALFLARIGHTVHAIDSASSGIAQLLHDAEKDNLPITAETRDLLLFTPTDIYDAVLFDRTLHMLDEAARLDLLKRCAVRLNDGGFFLILDESRNLPAIKSALSDLIFSWRTHLEKRGLLFLQRQD